MQGAVPKNRPLTTPGAMFQEAVGHEPGRARRASRPQNSLRRLCRKSKTTEESLPVARGWPTVALGRLLKDPGSASRKRSFLWGRSWLHAPLLLTQSRADDLCTRDHFPRLFRDRALHVRAIWR